MFLGNAFSNIIHNLWSWLFSQFLTLRRSVHFPSKTRNVQFVFVYILHSPPPLFLSMMSICFYPYHKVKTNLGRREGERSGCCASFSRERRITTSSLFYSVSLLFIPPSWSFPLLFLWTMQTSPLRQQLRRADTPHPSLIKQEAQRTKQNKKSPQEFLLFLISGGIGTALFYLLYEFLYVSFPFQHYKATLCWVISYLCSIVWQLELHRRLAFLSPLFLLISYLFPPKPILSFCFLFY